MGEETDNIPHDPIDDDEKAGRGMNRKSFRQTVIDNMSEVPMKPFKDTAFGRTLAGKNKTGRFIHSVVDVLPVPNVHEVIKAVIKDAEAENKALGTFDLVKETFQRLDYLRTGIGLALVAAYLLDYISVDKAMEALNLLISIFGG